MKFPEIIKIGVNAEICEDMGFRYDVLTAEEKTILASAVCSSISDLEESFKIDGYVRETVYNAFLMVEKYGYKSLAFPAISTGIFGVDFNSALEEYVSAYQNFKNTHPKHLKHIYLVLYNIILTTQQKQKYRDSLLDNNLKKYEILLKKNGKTEISLITLSMEDKSFLQNIYKNRYPVLDVVAKLKEV